MKSNEQELTVSRLMNLTTPLFLINSNHKIIAVNDAFCRFLNLKQEDIIGKKCYQIIHKTDKPFSHCPIYNNTVRERNGIDVLEAEFYEPKLKKYIKAELYPLIGSDIYLHTITDLTETELLKRNLDYFNKGIIETVKNLKLPYIVITKDLKVKEYSKEALDLIKFKEGLEDEGLSCGRLDCEAELCPGDIIKKVIEEKSMYHDVISLKRNNNECYIRRSIIPLVNELDEVDEVLIVLNDLIGVKKVKRKLNRTEEFLSSIIEGIGDALVVIDREFRILSANREYLKRTGKPIDRVRGSFCYSLSHRYSRPCYKEGEDCPVYKTFLTGQTCKSIHEHSDADNNVIYVEVVSYPLKDETGKVYAAVETLRDITDLKKIERERMELKIQLMQAQKMEAIGTLAAGIAHDFNNMLMGIAGFAEIIKKKNISSEIKEYVDRILNITNKASELTNQILIIGRKVKISKNLINLNKFVKDSIATIRRMIEENIIISAELWKDLPAIEADEGQLYQVLLNLVINARDVMPDGGRILIKTGIKDAMDVRSIHAKTGRFVFLSIKDTGPGIPEYIRERIFEPFFTTKSQGKGTGLGLSVVYSIVNEHGGFIELNTELGKGTEFIIYFPALTDELKSIDETVLVDFNEIDGKGKTVLVAEDEEVIRDLLSICLNEWGFKVLMAKNGEEAIRIFERLSENIDFVILDKVMPNLSGIEALKRMKDIKNTIKSIISTGYTSPEELREIEHVGVNTVLKKPFKIEQLKEAILKLLKG